MGGEFPQGLKEELGFKPDDYVILFVARLIRAKGVDVAIRALKYVVESEPSARLLIVGDGHNRKEFEKLAKSLGLWEYTKFIGGVRYQEVRKYYKIGDVFLSPNLYNLLSNTCVAVIEAMASGVPVIVLGIGEAHKLIKDGETGFIVQFNGRGIPIRTSTETCRAVADVIRRLLKDAELRKKIGERGRESVLAHLPDWDEWIELEASLIREVTEPFEPRKHRTLIKHAHIMGGMRPNRCCTP